MKILYITDDFPPESVGGAGQVVFDSARIMQSLGHKVSVLSAVSSKEKEGIDKYEGTEVNRIFYKSPSKFSRAWLSPLNPWLSGRVKKILKDKNPDIVHIHNVHIAFSFASIKWAKDSGAKVFFTAHDTLSFSYTRLYNFLDKENPICKKDYDYRISWKFLLRENRKSFNPFRAPLIRYYLNNYTDGIFAVSGELKKAMEQNGIRDVSVLYNGINVDDYRASIEEVEKLRVRLGFSSDKKIIFFGGRGMSDKGVEIIVESIPIVKREVPEALWVLAIGKDEYQKIVSKKVEALGMKDSVLFTGLMFGRDLAALFGMSYVVTVPSLTMDPAPLMNMQAMAAGKPVVGTCFGGTPEIVLDGICGYIVNPYDKKGFCEKIIALLKDPELAHNMGLAGVKRVEEEFSLVSYGRRLITAYGIKR